MKNIYLHILIIITSITFSTLNAQSGNNDITIITSGRGNTIEEAQQSAIRSAIEQACGAFISINTELSNDHLILDEMSSISSGNVKSIQILTQDSLPKSFVTLTIKATVSVDKLINFVQSKGYQVEIKGGLFAANIKQQILNETNEYEVLKSTIGMLHEIMQDAFDFAILSEQPYSVGGNEKWRITHKIRAIGNFNLDFCGNYLKKILDVISLNPNQRSDYLKLNKDPEKIVLNINNQSYPYYLRTKKSASQVYRFFDNANFEFYTRLFVVESNLYKHLGIGFLWGEKDYYTNSAVKLGISNWKFESGGASKEYFNILFPSSSQIVAEYTYNDDMNLETLEKFTTIAVKGRGIISHYRAGGFALKINDYYELIIPLDYLENCTSMTDAELYCDNLVTSGFDDWRLPNENELKQMFLYFHKCDFEIMETREMKRYHSYTKPSILGICNQHVNHGDYENIEYWYKGGTMDSELHLRNPNSYRGHVQPIRRNWYSQK
jgi:hypothetical protein